MDEIIQGAKTCYAMLARVAFAGPNAQGVYWANADIRPFTRDETRRF